MSAGLCTSLRTQRGVMSIAYNDVSGRSVGRVIDTVGEFFAHRSLTLFACSNSIILVAISPTLRRNETGSCIRYRLHCLL